MEHLRAFYRRLRQLAIPVQSVALLLVAVGAGILGCDRTGGHWSLSVLVDRLGSSIGSDLISIAITVLLVDTLYERHQRGQLKTQLIRELGSEDNGIAARAAVELRAHGWLEDGSLAGAPLCQANLAGARLDSARLIGAQLFGARLQDAGLSGALLRDACLVTAHLEGARLYGADLSGADLSFSNLEGALFRVTIADVDGLEASLERAKLRYASYDSKTAWPRGFDPKAAGAIDVDKPVERQLFGAWFRRT